MRNSNIVDKFLDKMYALSWNISRTSSQMSSQKKSYVAKCQKLFDDSQRMLGAC